VRCLPIAVTWDGRSIEPRERVRVGLAREHGGLHLRVDAPDHGDPRPPGPPGPTERLWDYEVVELLLCGPGERYLEVELGPGGHHLVLLLDGVRRPLQEGLPLEARWTRGAGRWKVRAHLPDAWLPPPPWRATAYAIHGLGPARRYLAHAPVPGDGPDFHRLHAFPPLDLEAP